MFCVFVLSNPNLGMDGGANSPQSLDIGPNLDGGMSDFQISGQFHIKGNRTSDDIDIKPDPVTKIDKRNKTTSKTFDDNVMSENCDVITIFSDLRPISSNPEGGFRTHSL